MFLSQLTLFLLFDKYYSKIYRFVLDDSPESLLEPGFAENGAWILKPKDGNFQAIQRLVNNLFNENYAEVAGSDPTSGASRNYPMPGRSYSLNVKCDI